MLTGHYPVTGEFYFTWNNVDILCGVGTTDLIIIENQEIVNQGPEVLNKKLARKLTVHIDRCAYIFRCVLYISYCNVPVSCDSEYF